MHSQQVNGSTSAGQSAGTGRRVAVTGGLGFVGRRLCRRLADAGDDVRVLDLAAGPSSGNELCRVNLRRVDLRCEEGVRAALAGIDVVYHLAGNPSDTRSVADPVFDFETNAVATLNVCAGALAAGVQRLVYLSSAMVYGRPQTTPMTEDHPTRPFLPYGASKRG